MDTIAYIDAVAEHGSALVNAASRTPLDIPVPDCPGWVIRDLIEHVAMVHRWATRHVREGVAAPEDAAPTPPLADEDLIAWLRDGHAALVTALREAGDDLEAMRFLHDAPPARTFWARRQAHETAIHRSDVEVAAGQPPTFEADFATDGIDELLVGFYGRRRGRLTSDEPRTLGVRTTDTDTSWLLSIGPDGRDILRGGADIVADADCRIEGPASSVYPFLWNRTVAVPPVVTGDRAVHDLWRERANVGWT